MLRVALTGGIASGKTTVSNAFSALGVPIADADILARQAVAIDSPGLRQVTERFGVGILQADGSLNRAKLREIIFSDNNARADLESIVHPEVRRLTNELIEKFEQTGHPYCLIVVPLLVETGQQNRYDHIVVVDVAVEVQISRLQSRDGGTVDDAKKILNSQASRQDRLAIADNVITNNGDINDIHEQVKDLHEVLMKLAIQPDN